MGDLTGKTALVTGASAPRGIGRAIALRLAEAGANVVVGDLHGSVELGNSSVDRADLLAGLADEIAAAPQSGTGLAARLDVTSGDDVDAAVAATMSAFGSLDILVNNAGSLAGSAPFLETTPAQWESSFQVNLLGPMRLAQAVIPIMQAQGGGRIINIGSTGSLGAEPGFGAYTAMKHGLIGFTKTLAAEFGRDGILCNAVCPGYIETDMHLAANERLAEEQSLPIAQVKKQRYASVALRCAGLPRDVADAVAYLASPQSRYVTGISLPVTGGVPPGI